MSAKSAVEFLIEDHGDKDASNGARNDFANDKPYLSILQRNEVSLEDLLKKFDWTEDEQTFLSLYSANDERKSLNKLIKSRNRVNFMVCATREFNEDFGREDVSCLKDLRMPFLTSRTPLKSMRDEFSD